MSKQSAALHYAEVLENYYLGIGRMDATGAAAELRRLHEANQELLEAIKAGLDPTWECKSYHPKLIAAIAKHGGAA